MFAGLHFCLVLANVDLALITCLSHMLAPQEMGCFSAVSLEDSDLYRVVLDFALSLIG